MILNLFDKSLQIYRLKGSNLNNKTTFQSTATVDGALQNKMIHEITTMGIVTSRIWMAYLEISTNIKKGDQIRYNGKTYAVTDVTPRDYGVNQHLECELKEANE